MIYQTFCKFEDNHQRLLQKRRREVVQLLEADGWYEVRVTGSHHHFKHSRKTGIVTVPHPKKQIGKELLNSIFKKARLKEKKL